MVVGIATVESPDPATPEGSYTSPCYWLNGELHFLVDQYDVPNEIERWMDGEAKGFIMNPRRYFFSFYFNFYLFGMW